MTTDERARTKLHERLDQAVGPDAADTLMSHLPPTGWGDVATRRDLDIVAWRLEAAFERALRQAVLALVAAVLASVGAAVGITQLLG